MLDRIVRGWVHGGFLAGLLILTMMPLLAGSWTPALASTFLCLPIYMIHQFEEHDDDRFRRYVNEFIGGGREVLSPWAVFLINIPGVWGVIAASTWLAARIDVGLGLIAAYLVLVNAVSHIGSWIALRRYNPGVITAAVLFLPMGSYTIWAIDREGGGTVAMHLIGLGTALAIHAAIIGYVASNRGRAREIADIRPS